MKSAPAKNIFRILEFYNANRDVIDISDLVASCTTNRSFAISKDFFVKIGTESVPISFVGNKILGHLKGAYTSSDPDGQERIYLNSDWLIKADKEEI